MAWLGFGEEEEKVADNLGSTEFKLRMFPGRNSCSW